MECKQQVPPLRYAPVATHSPLARTLVQSFTRLHNRGIQ
jgi:hypothetical protein